MKINPVRMQLIITLLCLLYLTFAIPATYAQSLSWSQTEKTGSWELDTMEHWKSETESPATLTYTANLTDFVMWRFKIKPHGDAGMFVTIKGQTTLLCGDDGILISYELGRNIFGIYNIHYYFYWITDNQSPTSWDCFYDSGVRFSPEEFSVTFYRDQNDHLIAVIQHSQFKFSSDFGTPASWNLTLTVKHEFTEGVGGYIEGEYGDGQIQTGTVGIPDPTPAFSETNALVSALSSLSGLFYNLLPDWAQDAIDSFTGFIGFIMVGVGITIGILTQIAPYAGALYALYWAHLIAKCCREGTIEPIVNHLHDMFNLFSSIIQAIRALIPI